MEDKAAPLTSQAADLNIHDSQKNTGGSANAKSESSQHVLPETRNGAAAAAGPAPPPTKSINALMEDLNRIPLFMTHLDETDGGGGSNAQLDALRALAYEGTKAEIAQNFREQGNECARAKQWRDARDFYTQALDVLRGVTDKAGKPINKDDTGEKNALKSKLEGDVGEREVDWLHQSTEDGDGEESKVVDLEEEERKEKEIEEACACNRALCNIELKNFGSAARDTAAALKLNPRNSKAYYRSGVALLAVDKVEGAQKAIDLGLSVLSMGSKEVATFEGLRKRIGERQSKLRRDEKERIGREQKVKLKKLRLAHALKERGIVVATSNAKEKPDLEDAEIKLEDENDPKSELKTPVLILYPTVARSELLKEVKESDTMEDILGTVLPVPWDGQTDDELDRFGAADGKGVEVFVETAEGGLRKIGKRVAWRKVIEKGGVKVVDGLIRVSIVPRGRVKEWIEDWKKMHGK